MSGSDLAAEAGLAAVAALSDETRRSLYRHIAVQGRPVGREEAAAALGIPHHVARFHLDRLHEVGLLEVEFRRPPGRAGPGAGHPTKLYKPASIEFTITIPERRYDVAAHVLSRAVAAALANGVKVADALETAGADAGRALGKAARPEGRPLREEEALSAAIGALDAFGFYPRPSGDEWVFGNCPFRVLADAEPEVVCRMNVALVGAVLKGCGARHASAHLDPEAGDCCVTVKTKGHLTTKRMREKEHENG